MILFIILLLTTIEQFGVDAYLPSMPAMGTYFGASDAKVQLSLSLYMLGFSLSPLIAGPLTDRYGRKPLIIGGLAALIVATIFCIFAPTINSLLWGRILMGFAGGFLVVANQSMVRDSFDGEQLVRVASYMSLTWSFVPIVAPAIGGYIEYYLNWQANFALIVLYAAIGLAVVWFSLTETMTKAAKPIVFKFVMAKYYKLLTNRMFLLYTACTALTFGMTTIFITASPFLFQDLLGYSPVVYGWIAFSVACSYLLGTYLNTCLIKFYSALQLIRVGVIFIVFFSAIGLLWGVFGVVNLWVIALPASAVIFFEGLVYPNAAALAFQPITKNLGIASALYISLQLLTCAVTSAVMAKLPEHNQVALMSFMLLLSLLLAFFYFSTLKKTPNH